MRFYVAAALFWSGIGFGVAPVHAQDISARLKQAALTASHEQQCLRYNNAWQLVLARLGASGLSDDFVLSHKTFIASACTAPAKVCPKSTQDKQVATLLSTAALTAGIKKNFLPFACSP